jgi:hypothetical protein
MRETGRSGSDTLRVRGSRCAQGEETYGPVGKVFNGG